MQFARVAVHNHRKRHITTRNGMKVTNTSQSGPSVYAEPVTNNCIVLND